MYTVTCIFKYLLKRNTTEKTTKYFNFLFNIFYGVTENVQGKKIEMLFSEI